ncbi:MAG: BlaI/MecI/CopY family transcriptional regulator [Ruminococcaceae bacterium]|nr:BlaI/MecI/CopY family transcriptional regulator [Oscillospiraceae bacterium]
MKQYQMGAIESRFADIIWENEPISSAQLARRSEELLAWKKTTSYTVLKRLCDKGLFVNNRGTVTSLISKAQYMSYQSEQFLNETFEGSLPAFLAAFTAGKTLTAEEVACLRRMVAEYEESTT